MSALARRHAFHSVLSRPMEMSEEIHKCDERGDPLPEVRCCYNCRYLVWAVGVGLGLRCSVEEGEGIPVRVVLKWGVCDGFKKG